MEEAESLCDHIAIMDHGRIIAQGTLGELRTMTGERDLLRLSGRFDAAATLEAIQGLDGAEIVLAEAELLTLALRDGTRKLPAVFEAVSRAGGEIRETTLTQPSLENLFIKLTGKELRE
jgi:ABC-2 type transport system ATP-binding protein